MTRRSMPSSFHANLFALVPARCPSSTCGVVMVVIGAALGRSFSAGSRGHSLGAVGALASHRVVGKMRPGFWPNSGSRFPDGVGCGKRDPEYCSETGCRFPTRLNRKAHPILRRQNGMRFPRDRIYAAVLSDSPATRPGLAPRARPVCPPRSRRQRLPALRGRGSPS